MKPQIFDRRLFVSLGSDIDSHRFWQYSRNQQFQELEKPKGFIYYEVNSLIEAKELTQKFIKVFDINSSNWTGGRVIDEEDNFVARISYNGRVWESENFPCKEIEI